MIWLLCTGNVLNVTTNSGMALPRMWSQDTYLHFVGASKAMNGAFRSFLLKRKTAKIGAKWIRKDILTFHKKEGE